MVENPASPPNAEPTDQPKRVARPFRMAVLRGLGVVMPPLLTLVIFLWIWNTIVAYMLEPLENLAGWTIVQVNNPTRDDLRVTNPADGTAVADDDWGVYKEMPDGRFIPLAVYKKVQANLHEDAMPYSSRAVYRRYVHLVHLQRKWVVPTFLCIFTLVLYLLGKFLAAGVGSFFHGRFEYFIHRLPLVRNVYSSVKQVTDFMFNEREIEYMRVVAVEYPRKGIWALAMVTGESMLDLRCAANEPVLSVLVPTSPMPFTGFTITVRKSETIDLNITMDQAFQFIVSCGVVVPPQQLQDALERQQKTAAAAPAQIPHAPDATDPTNGVPQPSSEAERATEA